MHKLFLIFSFCFLQYTFGDNTLCGDKSVIKTRSCNAQILGKEEDGMESCKVIFFPSNSIVCEDLIFGPLTTSTQIGGVKLNPYILTYDNVKYNRYDNLTVLNITFTNINWKNMNFRVQQEKDLRNHCRTIYIAKKLTLNDQSVLYYDCYWSMADFVGQSHILDFEATDDKKVINRGQYYFTIPSARMLNPKITTEEWKPFIYIEKHTSKMILHILPPPEHLKIREYRIKVIKKCEEGNQCNEIVQKILTNLRNKSDEEVIYEYSLLSSGSYYFVVTPLHDACTKDGEVKCQYVESPRVPISIKSHQPLVIYFIVSISSLIVALLLVYYFLHSKIRKYYCKDYRLANEDEIYQPPQILVVYSHTNNLHSECVVQLVNCLRTDYGFQVKYDGDIDKTSHADPYMWAEEAFRTSTHIMFIASPPEESNRYNNLYGPPLTAYRGVDHILLNFLKVDRASKSPKYLVNVYFEHSAKYIPEEARHADKEFYLLKQWHHLIAYLSKKLLAKKYLQKTEKGKSLLEALKRAEKCLAITNFDVIVQCHKTKNIKKKILL